MKLARRLIAILGSLTVRVRASVWTLPIAKVFLAMGGLTLFALLGRSTLAEARVEEATGTATPTSTSASTLTSASTPTSPPPSIPTPTPTSSTTSSVTSASSQATPDSPVVLNAATEEELRRLPGIGPKKAGAILALRQKLGRFRQVDELLRVKGIGRTTLKRLRPLVRLDLPAEADGGAAAR